MSTTDHVPSGWGAFDAGEGEIEARDGEVVVVTVYGDEPEDWDEARLIAAAPELRAACEKFLAVFPGCSCGFGPPGGPKCLACKARAAVAKACGASRGPGVTQREGLAP